MPLYTPYTPMYQPYNYYQPQIQQPVQQTIQQPVQQPQNPSSMIWVRNATEAAMYPVAPNNAVALWDSGVSCIYLKQADASGKPTMKTYDLVERAETPPEAPKAAESITTDFATKAELAALAGVVKDVDGLIGEIRKDVDALKERKDENDGESDV